MKHSIIAVLYFLLISCEEGPPTEESIEKVDVETTISTTIVKKKKKIPASATDSTTLQSSNGEIKVAPSTFENDVDLEIEDLGDSSIKITTLDSGSPANALEPIEYCLNSDNPENSELIFQPNSNLEESYVEDNHSYAENTICANSKFSNGIVEVAPTSSITANYSLVGVEWFENTPTLQTAFVKSSQVTLDFKATDKDISSFYLTSIEGCISGGNWVDIKDFSSGYQWDITTKNSENIYYIKFRKDKRHQSDCMKAIINHDDSAPTTPSLTLDSNASSTLLSSVTLSLSAIEADLMYVTNTTDCGSGGTWEAYTTSKSSWELAQSNSIATVFVKFGDLAGNESSCVSDTILQGGPAPSNHSISFATTTTNSATQSLTLAATDASEMYITNTAECTSGGTWETYATSKSWTLAQTNATAIVYAKYRSLSGLESSCISTQILHDNIAPTTTSIAIGSSELSDSTTQILTLTATDANEMYITNTAGCTSGGTWEIYATSKAAWILGQSNGTATVYVKFRDSLGNESSCISDTMTHDNTAPTSTSIAIDSGSSSTSNFSPTLTLPIR